MARRSNRRDFLRGRLAADTAADAIERAADGPASAESPGDAGPRPYVVQVARDAMACEFEVRLRAGQYAHGTEAALEALDLVGHLEDQISVFRESSEISRINRTAADRPVEVEPRLFGLVELALQLHRETAGAFDITSTPLWRLWGFARREGRVPEPRQIDRVRQNVGSHLLELDGSRRTIRFRRPGVEIGLGSIGKGYAIDRCAESLSAAGIDEVLIHGGASSVLATGSPNGAAPDPEGHAPGLDGWEVGIPHPLRPGRRLAVLRLRDRALATSGGKFQSFLRRGKRYGHILDPRTGWPAEGLLLATAIAPTAALADALATAFYVMGTEKVAEMCRMRPELAAVLVCESRRGGGIAVETFGLQEGSLALL